MIFILFVSNCEEIQIAFMIFLLNILKNYKQTGNNSSTSFVFHKVFIVNIFQLKLNAKVSCYITKKKNSNFRHGVY